MVQTALAFSHTLLKEIVTVGDIVLDATVGNGFDTLFLAELVGPTGQVYGFDVQAQAIETTRTRLAQKNLDKTVSLFHQGHETLAEVLSPSVLIKAAIFNLGYLPKSDKQIITQPKTTQQALDALLPQLIKTGRIVIVAYYGHEGGKEELYQLTEYCTQLPQEKFSVFRYQFMNQKNNPPILFCIEKK